MQIPYGLIFISYCINTIKYWLCVIVKENELASLLTVLSYGKNISSHYIMTLSRDKCVLSQTLSDGTATFIFTCKS